MKHVLFRHGFLRLFSSLALGALLASGCGPPADPGRTRPSGVDATPYAQRDLRVDGLRIRYVDEGPTEPLADPRRVRVAVLIPGHTSRIEEVDGLMPVLARQHRVLVLDFPGSGYAEKPDRRYDLRLYEDTLVGFLDALGVGRVHLVGGSLGGNLALRTAYRFPERVERLAVWAPGSAWESRPWLASLMRRLESYALFWPIVWVQSRYWYDEDFADRDALLAGTFDYYREVLGPGFVAMYFGMAATQVEQSLFPLAPEIRHPVWLAWGDRDHGADMGKGVARLHALLPRSELRVFPGAGHALANEVTDTLAAEVDAFLRRPAEELP